MPDRSLTSPGAPAPERPIPGRSGADVLRRMRVWTVVMAVLFALMTAGMLTDPAVSPRVTAAGMGTAGTAALLLGCALWGKDKSGLFRLAAYLAFFWAWILVPVAGMEAWLLSQELSAHSYYAAQGWQWTYALCGLSTLVALRLLLLRHILNRTLR